MNENDIEILEGYVHIDIATINILLKDLNNACSVYCVYMGDTGDSEYKNFIFKVTYSNKDNSYYNEWLDGSSRVEIGADLIKHGTYNDDDFIVLESALNNIKQKHPEMFI